MVIRGEKVLLRPIQPSDFSKFAEWSNDEEVCRYLEGDYPKRLDEYPAWHQHVRSDRHSQHFAISTHGDVLIGHIELDHIAWRSGDAELRIRIGEKRYWDQGYGTDAVRALVCHAFSALRLRRVYLRVLTLNKRAIRCYEKVGFRKEGRVRRPRPDGTEATILLMRITRAEFCAAAERLRTSRLDAGVG